VPNKFNVFTGLPDIVNDVAGMVLGPGISTDNAIPRFDGTTGTQLQNSGTTLSDTNVLSTGELNLTTDLAVEYGGTGRSSADVYSVICGGTTSTGPHQSVASLGSSGQVLTSSGAGALPVWSTVSGTGDVVGPASATDNAVTRFDGATGKPVQNSGTTLNDADQLTTGELILTTDLAVSHGGSGRSSAAAYRIICGGTTSTAAHQSVASEGSSGEVLTSNGAGALPTFQATGSYFTWNDVTSGTQALSVQNGYVTNFGAGVTYTLPASASVGDEIRIVGNQGIATIAQNAGQQIFNGDSSTTAGVTGSAVATDAGDCIHLVCITANTEFRSVSTLGS
jgi:hypothetical protein